MHLRTAIDQKEIIKVFVFLFEGPNWLYQHGLGFLRIELLGVWWKFAYFKNQSPKLTVKRHE